MTVSISKIKAGVLIMSILMFAVDARAQQEPLFTQYVNAPICMNPSFTGNRNSLAIDMTIRKQWMGIDGAPESFTLGVHSPINKSRVSLGGYITTDKVGPIKYNQFSFAYAYQVRLSDRMFLSMGTQAGLNHYNIGLTNMKLNDPSDPNFGFNIENAIKPTWGFGATVFTPKYHIAISSPQIILNELSAEENNSTVYQAQRNYYINGGYTYKINKKQSLQGSTLIRLADSSSPIFDFNVLFNYNKTLWFGASYRLKQTIAAMVNYQVTKNIAVCYSYDFNINTKSYFKQGSHEITLSYDCFKFYKKNKYRNFKRKKADEEDSMRSIRSF